MRRGPLRKNFTIATGALALVASAMATTGCATAGLAVAGPLASALYAVVDRSVERTLPADMSRSWDVTTEVLSRSALRIQDVDRDNEAWRFTGSGESLSVSVKLERVTPTLTRLSLRAETGGLTADKKTAEEILNQITATLSAPPPTRSPDPNHGATGSAEALASLRREVERLVSIIDQPRPADPAARVSPAALEPGRILAVPSSTGVPSLPATEGMPARVLAIGDQHRPPVSANAVTPAAERAPASLSNTFARPLKPADTLSPVEPFDSGGSSTSR